MIVAKLEELAGQIPPSAALQTALAYLSGDAWRELPDGRYEVDGQRVYALVQSYQTLPITDDSKYEAHHNYIDVQFIAAGVEVMGWAPLDQMQVNKPYNPEKDVVLGTCPRAVTSPVIVSAGQAAIFFPSDAHAPKLACGEPGAVRKVVLKVAVEG